MEKKNSDNDAIKGLESVIKNSVCGINITPPEVLEAKQEKAVRTADGAIEKIDEFVAELAKLEYDEEMLSDRGPDVSINGYTDPDEFLTSIAAGIPGFKCALNILAKDGTFEDVYFETILRLIEKLNENVDRMDYLVTKLEKLPDTDRVIATTDLMTVHTSAICRLSYLIMLESSRNEENNSLAGLLTMILGNGNSVGTGESSAKIQFVIDLIWNNDLL